MYKGKTKILEIPFCDQGEDFVGKNNELQATIIERLLLVVINGMSDGIIVEGEYTVTKSSEEAKFVSVMLIELIGVINGMPVFGPVVWSDIPIGVSGYLCISRTDSTSLYIPRPSFRRVDPKTPQNAPLAKITQVDGKIEVEVTDHLPRRFSDRFRV